MNKFLKFNLFNRLEVSVNLSHLVPVRRMSSVNNDSSDVKDENSIVVIPEHPSNQTAQRSENIVQNYNGGYNLQNWYPYSAHFNYQQVYYSNNFYTQPQPYPYNFNYPFYWNNFSFLSQPPPRLYFHRGLKNYSSRNLILAERIMSLRSWETVTENPGMKPGFIFTLMSYNVLAQDLLDQHTYLYQKHDAGSLAWPFRWNNLFKEISRFKPDILCLQEVQQSHLADYYSILETLGYQSVFKKRTGSQTDGCAIYYKTENISLVDSSIVEYFQQAKVSLLDRDNVGIVMKFVPRMHPTREFVVATTHLLYNPRRDDVRMAQMQLLLTEVEAMSFKRNGTKSHYLPVIITGDLNTPPESDLYEFVTKGSISYRDLSPKMLETDKKMLVTSFLGITDNCQHAAALERRKDNKSKDKDKSKSQLKKESDCKIEDKYACKKDDRDRRLSHSFKFKSVYNHGEPDHREATTHQQEWLTVDYIFYSEKKGKMYPEEKLKVLSRYRLPTGPELEGITFPNNVLGSDHLALIAKFKLEF